MFKLARSPMRSLLMLSAVALAAPALAQSIEEETVITSVNPSEGTTTKTFAISTRGLNLADGRDYARLQHRVARAAEKVCTTDGNVWRSNETTEYYDCHRSAIAQVMAHLPAAAAD